MAQGKLKLFHADVNNLCTNTTKVLYHISGRLDSIEPAVPAAVVSDKVAQLWADVNSIMKSCNIFSKEMYFQFSRVANRLAIVKQNPGSATTLVSTAQVFRGSRKLAGNDTYLLDSDFDFWKNSSPSDSEAEPRLGCRVSQQKNIGLYFLVEMKL